MARSSLRLLLLATLLLGVGLRLSLLDAKSIWLDEAFSLWMATHPLPQIWTVAVQLDQHPPLYYWLLAIWTNLFGSGESSVRLLSAGASALVIPVTYAATHRLLGRPAALAAAALVAISPFQIQYGQEARMYALLSLAAAVAIWALGGLLTEPAGNRDARPPQRSDPAADRNRIIWLGLLKGFPLPQVAQHPARSRWLLLLTLVLAEATALWLHNTALFLALALNLAALVHWLTSERRRDPRWVGWWLAGQALVLALWLPWLPGLASQIATVDSRFWIQMPAWHAPLGTLRAFSTEFLPSWLPMARLWPLPFLALAAWGSLALCHQPRRLAPILLLLATPLLAALLISLRRPIYLNRTLIWVSLPYFMLLAWGVRSLPRRSQPLAALLLALPTLFSLYTYYVHSPKEEWRQAAAHLAQTAAPGDLLLFNSAWIQLPFDFYFRPYGLDVAKHGLPDDPFVRGELEPPMLETDLPRLHDLLTGHDRVWLIQSHTEFADPQKLVLRTLQQELELVEETFFVGIAVRLYGSVRPHS